MKFVIVLLSTVLCIGFTVGIVTAHNKNITRVPEILKAPQPPKIDGDLFDWPLETSITGYQTPDSKETAPSGGNPAPKDEKDFSFEMFAIVSQSLVVGHVYHRKLGYFMNFNSIDLHVHAGIERPVPMDNWMDGLIRTGRTVLGLVDHYELYLKSDEDYVSYLARKGFPRWYANGLEGFRTFCNEVRQQGKRSDITVLLGLEVYHGDFPDLFWILRGSESKTSYIRKDFLEGLDFIGCHISKTESFEPWGDFLLKSAEKLSHTAHENGIIGVLFHPFDHSFWAHRQGMTPERGLHIIEPDKLADFAEKMAKLDIYVEINWGSDSKNLNQPEFIREYIPVIQALKSQGVRFWLGSDVHHSINSGYNIDQMCAVLNISVDDIWIPDTADL